MCKRVITLLLAMLFILLSASCSETVDDSTPSTTPSPETSQPASTPSPQESSPTMSEEAMLNALRDKMANYWERIDGSTATIPLTKALYNTITNGSQPPEHNTTPDAYRRLIDEEAADLIFVTYPSENEFDMASYKGIELEIIPVTKDALVFLANVLNPVDSISLTQLRDVYTGGITNWDTLGGIDEGIIPYQRSADSGSQTLFLKLVMDGLAPMDPPSEWITEEMGALVESVSYYDNSRRALGYSMFYYVNNMYGNDRFKLLGIDGVTPARDTITSGQYPLETFYYAVMRKNTPEDSPARALVDWLLTDSGQKLAIKAGYIPLREIEGVLPENDIDPIYLGDTDNSSGTGGTAQKKEDDDIQPVNGVRPPLSDLFFDGFNYIQYINGEIVAALNDVDHDFWYSLPLEERHLTRPFPGIPNDYPLYDAGMGYLYILFPDYNPFFTEAFSFYINLTEDISPYGYGLRENPVTYFYDRRLLPNVDLYVLTVSIPGKPDVTDFINLQLKTWTDTFPGGSEAVELLEGFCKWNRSTPDYPYRLQPYTGTWRDFLSVTYILQTYDGPFIGLPVAYTICFDCKTGYTVDLASKVGGSLDYTHATGWTPMDFTGVMIDGYPPQEFVPEGYVPPAGSVITRAWIADGLGVDITEPSGRELQYHFWDFD